MKGNKLELVLDGLDCANCSAKIERAVNNFEEVESAYMNFVTKVLTIMLKEEKNRDNVLGKTKETVNKYEPHVKVRERKSIAEIKKIQKHENKISKVELILEGLDCANCSAKIERAVGELSEVKDASMNFVSKVLTINLKEEKNKESIINKTKEIVNKYEPDVKVSEKNAPMVRKVEEAKEVAKEIEEEREEKFEGKRKIYQIAIGAVIAIIAALLKDKGMIGLVLFIISYLLIGGEIVLKAFRNISRGQVFDENFLMTVATLGAFAINDYAEAVAVMLFYQVGEIFQDYAVDRSRKSISALLDIRPDYANLLVDSNISKVSPEEVEVGDVVIVKPGERVPLDGVVLEGESFIDTSALTGESVQRRVKEGSEILSGFINKTALLKVKVSKNYGQSTVAKILDLVENAGAKKAPTEKFITKFARYYTPAVVFTAVALAILPPLFIEGATFSEWIYRALTFLVISCPCALVVSIPLTFFGGIGASSKKGILVKGGNYLEALNNVDTVVFDKTGTLTKGEFKVNNLYLEEGINKEDFAYKAALIESFSNHPIAISIRDYYGKEVDKNVIKDYEEIWGMGVKALIDGKKVLLGNDKLMSKENIKSKEVEDYGTITHLAVDGVYWGYMVISDQIKEDSKDAIKKLKEKGINNIVMLTGDSKKVGEKVGEILNIDKVYSELLPGDKVDIVEKLYSNKKGNLIFVGDGINDAPVLRRADIGVAMGALGSDAAIEASDVVIMTDEPSKLITAIQVAKKTRRIVMQNIVFALGVKIFVLILAALGLTNMWAAVFADVGVALIAVLNAMRIVRV
ncbi:cadmium-translocating P-type ATPase [Clostridium sp. MSJ-11]|uniref:Cd(2+)-exporting ATPase n=1 Tax=Clostridium mobile TaxID=2841512 RepID=A0ABS6EDT5_9CLOT|nr:heavy metal translocating P-type ATPase [Clostridium mobile]MBU5483353.1 cadmium-translocating P-type ATPase [Clostridium mobile]